MCYQRARSAVCCVRRWIGWLWHLPTKGQKWTIFLLLLVALSVAGRSARVQRDQLLRDTAKQTSELEMQLQSEIDDAKRMREYLQDQVDDIERRLSRLEQSR